MKTYESLWLLIALVIFSSHEIKAQIDLKSTYDDFKKQVQQDYHDFRDEANLRYASFMKQAWEQYNIKPAIPRPKDETVPPIVLSDNDKKQNIGTRPMPIGDIIESPRPQPRPLPLEPIREQQQNEREVAFNVFGTACEVRFNDKARFRLNGQDLEALSAAWKILSENGVSDNTIRDCLELRIKLQLCDWAYLNMLYNFAETVYGKSDEAILLTAYLYCQSGYSMRLSMSGGHIVMLYASKHGIYDTPYFTIDGIKFYPFNAKVDNLQICQASFPGEKPMSLFITTPQKFTFNGSSARRLAAKAYSDMNFTVNVNKNLIDFYNTYPTSEVNGSFMTRWVVYANTPMEEEIANKFYPTLRRQLAGLTELQAVEKLLNWVQTAFVYEYDDKVWGHDRAFFPEETLYYPYCDCEDRAILLTRLVRDLLGLKCILVYYPGHLAAAVNFTSPVKGDYLVLNGQRFTITDPTYIGAPVGFTMSDMDNKKATVILLGD